MARGSQAKTVIENKLATVFGKDYIGNIGGKIYLWADDGGERVQIAIAMTCPKTEVAATASPPVSSDGGWDWSTSKVPETPAPKPAEITQEEKDMVASLMEKFGL